MPIPTWLLVLATEAEGGKEPTFTDLKGITAVWVWAAFIVTFLILSKVAWPGLAKKLEEREIRIAEGLQKAEEAEQRAREMAEKQ
jgi:F0F1-type ATP synthase membrane subunit b/b'